MARTPDELLKLTLGDLMAKNAFLVAENDALREALAAAQAALPPAEATPAP